MKTGAKSDAEGNVNPAREATFNLLVSSRSERRSNVRVPPLAATNDSSRTLAEAATFDAMNSKVQLSLASVGLAAYFTATPIHASEIALCKTKVLQPIGLLYAEAEGVPAEMLPPTIKKGTIIRRVTNHVVDRKTGLTGFCAFRDTCYRATATVNGQNVTAQRLLNCTIDLKNPSEDDDTITYGLIPDPRRNSAHDMRVDRAFEGLLAFGIRIQSPRAHLR